MTPAWQISRYGSLWILIAFAASALPLLPYLPLWLPFACGLAIVWRVQIYRARWGAPGRALKLLLVLICVAGLLLSFGNLAGLDPMVSLLVSAHALKLLEMQQKRDALITLYLGLFVAVILCLFDQQFTTGLIVLLSLTAVMAGLAGINQSDQHSGSLRPLKTAAIIVLQALPLMLAVFLVLPRLGPLWDVPGPGGSARTGMSDTLGPGDITRLGRSARTAFRVQFDGPAPARQQLYWRGMTLSDFDGRTWSRSGSSGYPLPAVQWFGETLDQGLQRAGPAVDYDVTLESTGNTWLYSLQMPEPRSADVGLLRDFNLLSRHPVNSRSGYRVRSWPSEAMDVTGLTPLRQYLETRLPPNSNPQTAAIAGRWGQEAPSAEALIDRVLGLYNREFFYTLEPPGLGVHSVDEFLWSTKRGFCEHFASSFVFFMRAAGVPARVVVGYQGGEIHPEGGYLIVRQYDAHAWAEVWLQGRGWVRIDPTAAVAPERISRGLLDYFSGREALFGDTPLSLMRFRDVAWINQLRLQMDAFEYSWSKWVLGYDDVQSDVLTRLLGEIDARRMALFLLAAGLLALAPVLIFSLLPRASSRQHPLDREYLRFCAKMARRGHQRRSGETVRDFALRCAAAEPQHAQAIHFISTSYEQGRYRQTDHPLQQLSQLQQLRKQVRKLRI